VQALVNEVMSPAVSEQFLLLACDVLASQEGFFSTEIMALESIK
jgi:hypothetical protein